MLNVNKHGFFIRHIYFICLYIISKILFDHAEINFNSNLQAA